MSSKAASFGLWELRLEGNNRGEKTVLEKPGLEILRGEWTGVEKTGVEKT